MHYRYQQNMHYRYQQLCITDINISTSPLRLVLHKTLARGHFGVLSKPCKVMSNVVCA